MYWKQSIAIAVIGLLISGVVKIFILLLVFSNWGKLQQSSSTSNVVLLVFVLSYFVLSQLPLASPYHRFAKPRLVQKFFNPWTRIEEKPAGWTIATLISRWVMAGNRASRSWAQPWEMMKGAFFILARGSAK